MERINNKDPVNINIKNKQANELSECSPSPLTKFTRRKTLTSKKTVEGQDLDGYASPASRVMKAVDSKQSLFLKQSPDGPSEGGYELKTESQVLLERRKEHETKQAIKHKKDFIQYMTGILTRPAAVKETSTEPVNIRSILPLD